MRLRAGKSERDLKRRSTLDPVGLHLFRRGDKGDKDDRSTEYLTPERIAQSEDGRRPASSDVARPSTATARDSQESPSASPRPAQTNRRFSMLRFRHASDSQLSITAKEHADRDAPPVPPVPANAVEQRT